MESDLVLLFNDQEIKALKSKTENRQEKINQEPI